MVDFRPFIFSIGQVRLCGAFVTDARIMKNPFKLKIYPIINFTLADHSLGTAV